MRKLSKKLLLSVLSVALLFIALGTTTFAWFSMNSKVAVTGMKVHTQIDNNLFIAGSTLTKTTKEADADFKTSLVTALGDTLLEPVSTIDGVSYFYHSTQNLDINGKPTDPNTYTAYSAGETFDGNYGLPTDNSTNDALGYVDYVFQLKAVNTNSAAYYVNLSTINMSYAGTAETQKAFRIAMFVWDMGADGSTAAGSDVAADKLKTILAPGSAIYYTSGKAVSATDALDTVTNLNTAANIGSVAAGQTRFFKVVVRLWLEGEDNTCNNTTFASLTDSWSLDLKITFDSTTGGAAAIGQSQTDTKTTLSIASDAVGDERVFDGVSYKKVGSKQVDSKQLYVLTSTISEGKIAANSRFFIFDADDKPIEVTHRVTVGA